MNAGEDIVGSDAYAGYWILGSCGALEVLVKDFGGLFVLQVLHFDLAAAVHVGRGAGSLEMARVR